MNEEPERWTVEILLPWSIAPMREADGDTRLLGLSFQRMLYSRKEKAPRRTPLLTRIGLTYYFSVIAPYRSVRTILMYATVSSRSMPIPP